MNKSAFVFFCFIASTALAQNHEQASFYNGRPNEYNGREISLLVTGVTNTQPIPYPPNCLQVGSSTTLFVADLRAAYPGYTEVYIRTTDGCIIGMVANNRIDSFLRYYQSSSSPGMVVARKYVHGVFSLSESGTPFLQIDKG